MTSEEGLLAAVAAGVPDAVRVLLDEHAPTVYGFVYARVAGDYQQAEDILQETLMEAVRSAATFRGEAALTTWLCAIARRRIGRFYAQERRRELAVRGIALVAADEERQELNVDRREDLIRALRTLSPSHRQVLLLKYVDGIPVQAIADELGRTPVQVQSLLQRARIALRRALEPRDV